MPASLTVPSLPYIEFDTLDPATKGVIFSGIAVPEWHLHDDDNIRHMTYTINLGYQAYLITQATVYLGLASIYNGGSSFLFATDAGTLCIDDSTQELLLQVDLALMGDPANLSRISYQVAAIIQTQQTGISGTITFPADLFGSAAPTVSALKGLFAITANIWVDDGGGGFGQGHYNWVARGTITGVTVQGDTAVATYSIASAPYNLGLTALVATTTPTPQNTGFSQTSGPSPITITAQAPDQGGVNFTYFVSPIK